MGYNRNIYESIKDPEFANHFLGRLVSDCEYVLNLCMGVYDGYPSSLKATLKHLWAHNIDEQISLMKACKKILDKHRINPGISNEDISDYESKLKELENFNESNSSFQDLTNKIKDLYEDIDEYYMINDEDIDSFIDNIEYANKSELIDGVSDILDLIDDLDDDSDRSDDLKDYKKQFKKILSKLKKYNNLNENSKLKRVRNFNESNSSFQTITNKIRDLYEDIDEYYMIDDEDINSFIDNIEHASKSELIDGINDILDLINDLDDDSDSSDYLEDYRDQFEKILRKLM